MIVSMITVAVIDDNKYDRERMEFILGKLKYSNSVYLYESVDQFISDQKKVDLIVLDIDLNGKDGISEKNRLNAYTRFFVYATNLKSRMRQAFDKNVVGYLLKPAFDRDLMSELTDVFDRYLLPAVTFRTDAGELSVMASDIYYISRENRKIYVHLKSSSIRIFDYTLSQLHDLLCYCMIWIDRSVMVNVNHVQRAGVNRITLDNSETLYISKRRYNVFLIDFLRMQ